MAQIWFVQSNEDRIDGPLHSDEVEARLQSGQLGAQSLVWGPGMDHWRELSWWAKESKSFSTMNHTATQAPREVWHYALAGESHGPFSRETLIEQLKSCANLDQALLWTKGMKEWAPLFEFHDILTALGANKRQFPRADLTGQVTIKTNTGQTLVGQAITISEGGMGVHLDTSLTSGMVVSVEVQSPVFHSPLHVKAEVRFVVNGITGLRFANVSSEAKGAIVSLVKQNQSRFVLKAS